MKHGLAAGLIGLSAMLGLLSGCVSPEPIYDSSGKVVQRTEQVQNQTPLITEAKKSQDKALFDLDYRKWLSFYPWRQRQVDKYLNYLAAQNGEIGAQANELLLSAQSYDSCGRDKFALPPEQLWSNMLPTLQLLNRLKREQIFTGKVQVVSAYRDFHLNRCAGGADSSQHLQNSALDLWVEVSGDAQRRLIQNKLCQFWATHGPHYNFGLGLYASGSYHIDTGGFRTWGSGVFAGGDCRSLTGLAR